MASATDAPRENPQTPPESIDPASPRRGPVGGRRGRGGSRGSVGDANDSTRGDRGRGLHRGGRGRGYRGRGNSQYGRAGPPSAELPSPTVPLPSLDANVGAFGRHLTGDASKNEAEETAVEDDTQSVAETEAEVCFICASPVVHNAVSPCNHRTCHICALRLRALYKSKACAHCRTNAEYVIFTDDANRRYEDFLDNNFTTVDSNLGIKYEKQDIFEDTVLLLRYNCPDPSCDVACLGWPDLHRHVRSVHHKVMCDLCTRNKKVFTHEHELFTQNELRKHEKFGDDHPGAIDQSGFRGHPECGFCRQRFYGEDELYAHCRDRHERCHICDRRNQGRQPQYYINYDALEQHFRKDHFLCPDQECLDKKFVVFDSEMDLKAHQLEVHPNGLTKDARRDARRVDMSSFAYRAPHQPERGGRRGGREGREGRGERGEREGREGRGRGRGRDPNAEPLPASSAQPLRRDELAYQRQMAIQSAQSVSTRTFGGQLTSGDALAARPPARSEEPPTVTVNRPAASTNDAFPSLASLNIDSGTSTPRSTSSTQNLTPQEQARRLRHNAVTERAATLLENDQQKLEEFRSKVSSYRNSAMSASGLIDAFFALFDTSSAELGKLIKELADIFEIPSKRDTLLKAWSDWKAINEDYPSLPGPSGLPAGTGPSATSSGGSRVLKLKSSTAQSSRSAVSRHGSWGSAAGGSIFPPLSSGVAASANRAGAGRTGPVPWAGSTASLKPSPNPSRAPSQHPASRATIPSNLEAFPALPAAAKPATTVFSPGYGGGAVRRGVGGGSTSLNAWTNGFSGGGTQITAPEEGNDVETGAGQKRKGKQNKKQTLFHFG